MRGPFKYAYVAHALFRIDTRAKQKTIKYAITHLLNKALPQRCQIRNLKEIVHQYVREYPEIMSFMHEVMKPLGEHCDFFLEHQHVLFMFMKLFIVRRIHNIPPLLTHLRGRCNWSRFEISVESICARIQLIAPQKSMKITEIINYMNRMQMRNIMAPCFFHLFQYLIGWSTDTTSDFIHLKQNIVTFTPIKLMNSRVLEHLGMTTWEAYQIRGAMTQFLVDSNKNALCTTLNAIDTRNILKNTLRSIVARRKIHTINTEKPSEISLYICPVCEDIKNTLTSFTSLRSIVYDYDSNTIFCTKKRNAQCGDVELFTISMDRTAVLLNEKLYIICGNCAQLKISKSTYGAQSCVHICDECRKH